MHMGLVTLVAGSLVLIGCAEQTEPVSFRQDIKPILDRHCIMCHAEGGVGQQKSGLKLDSYENLIAGRVVTPGDTTKSPLLAFIHPSADPSKSMPRNAPKLSKRSVDLIKAWIEQGKVSPLLGLWWVHVVALALGLGMLAVQNGVHRRVFR